MKTKKLLTKGTLGLSLCAFCYPIFLSLYIIQNCPAILRATSHGSKGWYLVGGVGNGILFFSAVWIIYGIVRWVIIWPLYLIARCFCNSEKTVKADEPKDEQK
jgi:hypothetical protein